MEGFFAEVTAGRIRDRFFFDPFPPKKLAQFFLIILLVKFVTVTHQKWGGWQKESTIAGRVVFFQFSD